MIICGIDEAGRGPCAGPLVVAGVILKKEINNLNDSKKLSSKKREELYLQIKANSIYKIVFIDNNTIDKIGLSKSISNALNEIINFLDADEYIFDGNSSFGVDNIKTIIKADEKIPQVSAASILAKVSRDRFMEEIALKFPLYKFEKHKGYPTKEHKELIKKYGLSQIHRKSYKLKGIA